MGKYVDKGIVGINAYVTYISLTYLGAIQIPSLEALAMKLHLYIILLVWSYHLFCTNRFLMFDPFLFPTKKLYLSPGDQTRGSSDDKCLLRHSRIPIG